MCALMMEAARSSEMLVVIYLTNHQYIPADSEIHDSILMQ
jgi:hypothetical protein